MARPDAVIAGTLSLVSELIGFGFIADFHAQLILVGYINGVAITVIGQPGKPLGQGKQPFDKRDQPNRPGLAIGQCAGSPRHPMKAVAATAVVPPCDGRSAVLRAPGRPR